MALTESSISRGRQTATAIRTNLSDARYIISEFKNTLNGNENYNLFVTGTNYGKVDIGKILDTRSFDLEEVANSAGWLQELENDENIEDDDDEDDDHDHDHDEHEHHHHHHDGGETEEYGIGTFVYYRRAPFNRGKFEDFANRFPNDTVIRTKGILWFSNEPEIGYVFEQAGSQIQAYESGNWIASAPRHERKQILKENPDIEKDWDETYGDRMIKLVFIGKNMNKKEIISKLDNCLEG